MKRNAKVAIASLAFSAAALVGLFAEEGYTDTVVIPVKGDVPTIGFGTTSGVQPGDRTTPVKAAQRALRDVQTYEGIIKQCVTAPVSQGEYDGYVKFGYNIGAHNFCGSTSVKLLNAGQHVAACNAILLWKYAPATAPKPGKSPEPGLVRTSKGWKFDCSTPGNRHCAGLWQRRLEARDACVAAQ